MRILFLSSALTYGGTYVRCQELARRLERRGHEVCTVKLSETSRVKTVRRRLNGVGVLEMPRFWGMRWFGNDRLPSDILARLGHLARNRYDVIHLFSHHLSGYLPWRAARLMGSARVLANDWDDLWTDGGWFGDPDRPAIPRRRYRMEVWLERRSRTGADGVTAISRALCRRALDLGVPEERLVYLPAGADTSGIRVLDPGDARRRLGLQEGPTYLVYSGFNIPAEDLGLMLGSVKRAIHEGLDLRLLTSGLPSEEVETAARRVGLPPGVAVNLGRLDRRDFELVLGAADMALLPLSDSPTNRFRFPNKFGDYLAAGRSVVSSRVGDVGDLIDRYGVGVAGAPGDMTAGILEIARNPGMRAKMARRARRLAEEVLSWDRHAESLEDFYTTLLERSDDKVPEVQRA
jgi:glycosyltransferase involved in cell wall biosynthesis